jgi:hypothetical protein
LPDELVLFGVDRDDGLASAQVAADLLVYMAELRVTVWVLGAFEGLGIGLERKTQLAQQ